MLSYDFCWGERFVKELWSFDGTLWEVNYSEQIVKKKIKNLRIGSVREVAIVKKIVELHNGKV